MGQGFGAVLPVVVVGIVADRLMDPLLDLEVMGGCRLRWGGVGVDFRVGLGVGLAGVTHRAPMLVVSFSRMAFMPERNGSCSNNSPAASDLKTR
jgi:hypothetical protein